MRCSHCAHEWFQAPDSAYEDLDDIQMDADLDADISALEIEAALSEAPEVESEEPEEKISQDFSLDEMMADDGEEEPDDSDESEQSLEPEEGGADLGSDSDEESIPESVKPLPDDLGETAARQEEGRAVWIGYGAAAAIFFVIFGVLLALQGPLVRAWPPVIALYQMVGMDVPAPGEGLLLDHVKASYERDSHGQVHLKITGEIINLKDHPVSFPFLEVALREGGAHVLATHDIEIENKTIAAHGSLSFDADLQDIPDGVREVKVHFVSRLSLPEKLVKEEGGEPETHEVPSEVHH